MIPGFDETVDVEPEDRECLLEEGHDGDHLVRNVRGEYVSWRYDDCDCEEEDCQCFSSGVISEVAALDLIQKRN
jgi:hypothetical protein